MSNLNKELDRIAKTALTSQQMIRDRRSGFSKAADTVTNKSYANEDKKEIARRFREFETKDWKPKIDKAIKADMQKTLPGIKPGTQNYESTYNSYYNKAHKDLQQRKAEAQQRAGTLRNKGQTQRSVDNEHRLKAAEKSGNVKSTAAAMAVRDGLEGAVGGVGVGATRTLQFGAQTIADIGKNDDGGIFDRGAKALERHEKKLGEVYPAHKDIQQNGPFISKLAISAAEQIPTLAMSAGTAGAAAKTAQLLGATGKVAAATAYSTAAATMYPQAYGDGHSSTKQELEEASALQLANKPRSKELFENHFNDNIKSGLDEDKAWSKARDQTISSIAEESGHTVGVATLALSMIAPGVGSFAANNATGGAVTKLGQKVFNTLAVKADAGKVAKYAIPAAVGAGIVGLNIAEEGLQEGFTDKVAQQAAVDVGVKDKVDMAQLKEAVLMGGILGGAMGGGTYVGTRNSKLHQAQDDLVTAQQAYAEVAGQIPQLQQQIETVSPRSPEGQALTARVEETRAALDAMASEAEKASIPRSSLARRAPRIEPINNAANDFDGGIDGATEMDAQSFENALNPDGTPAPQATPAAPIMSEQELDAQDAQIAELIAEQQLLDDAIEDGSNEKPLEESIAAAQSWYDSKRGEGKQGLSGVVSRAAATEQDTAFAQQQEVIKGTTTTINDYIASERAKQQQIEEQLDREANAATTDAEKQAVAQKIKQREVDRAKEDELLSTREQLAQPYEAELFDTTIVGADGAPFKLARFWDSNMPAAAKAKAIADAFGGQVEQNVAKSDWSTLPEGVQKELHKWFTERLDGVRQSREAGEQAVNQVTEQAVEQPQEVAPNASGLTMPVQQSVAEQAPIAPVAAEQVSEVDSTPAATQLTDENPVINIPAPGTTKATDAPAPTVVATEQADKQQVYKSQPAARAAMKKQNIDPKSVSIVKVTDGYAIVQAGKQQTEQANGLTEPVQEQQSASVNNESVATDPIELTEQNPVINIPAPIASQPATPVVSVSTTEPADQTTVYKSKPAARAAIKKRKLNPAAVEVVQSKDGFTIQNKAPAYSNPNNHPPTVKYGRDQVNSIIGENAYGKPVYEAPDGQRISYNDAGKLVTSGEFFDVGDAGQSNKAGDFHTDIEVNAGKSAAKAREDAYRATAKANAEVRATKKAAEEAEVSKLANTASLGLNNEVEAPQSAPAKRAAAKKAVKNRASEDNQKVSNAEDLKPVQSEDMVTTNSASETKSIAVEVEADKQPSPEKSEEKADKPAKSVEPVAEIEDFGEKITGARKDMDSFYQREITDDDISSQPLSKIWPKKDIEAIEDKQTAALATVLRSTIPSKPRKGYKLNNWVEQVKNARGIMQQIMGDDTLVGQFIEQMTKVKGLQTTGYHAQLLSAIEQDQWARVTAVDHRPYYAIQNEDGSTSPDMSFDITIDKRRHVISTETKQISEVVGKVNEILSGEVKAATLKFDLYSRGRGDAKSWFITQSSDKDKTPLITFNDRDSARAFLKENNNDLAELWAQHKEKVNVKKTDTRSRQNRERIGPDHRSGQDITTEKFMKAFGLRGGQFGNWVKQGANSKDRQGMLNDAYDAFMDLAGVLGIPSEAIGLGGKLGMSFGARGKGSAMAHYEPSQVVINLTKTKGAGTLAHEWFHALDHHFTSFRDSPARNKSREDTYITYKPEPSMMYTPQKGRGYLISKPALEKRRANSKDPMYAAENWAPDSSHPEGVRPQVEEAFADLVNALNDSPMKDRATTIDKGAPDGYWSRIIERAARSFESYIIHKLEQQGARSDFLANVTPENAFPRNMDRYPYLLESEMAPVAEAFDNLFATIDSKASEDGNGKTLFSRIGQMKQVAESITTKPIKGVTGTTSQQIIGVLQKRFGKEAVASLVKSGKLRVRNLNDFVNADGVLLIPSDAEGFYHNGKVTLIADNLTADNAVATLLHEMGGHAGIQSMLAPQTYMGLMTNFDNLVKSGNKYAVAAKERAEAVTDTESEARDEYIPYLITEYAQANERSGPLAVIKRFVNRVLAGVRTWVRNTTGIDLKMTPNDITQLAERMVKRLAEQEASPLNIAGIDNVVAVQAQFSQVEVPQSQIDAVRKQYEGTDEWMKAPNGLPSKLTELQWLQVHTPSFKSWFGDWENEQRAEGSRGDNTRTTTGSGRDNGQLRNRDIGRSLDGPRNNGSGDSRNTGGGRQSESALLRTTDSQRITKLDTKTGEPRVFLHGTQDDFFIFDSTHANKKDFGWLGVGNYFTTNEQVAGLYALNKKGGSGDKSVMNVYLNARNPFVATKSLKNMIRDGGKAEAEEFTQYLIDNGHDSVVLDNGADNLEVMVLDANQVKSATDNAGTFDANNPDIRFSRRYSNADQSEDAATKQQRASSAVRLGAAATSAANAGTIRILRRHIATPQHVALLNPDFKKFTDNIQARLAYENHEAGKVQVHVPEIWQTRLLVGKRKKDIESVSKALFDGTMADKVWDNDELVDEFGLTPEQINLYGRMRASINDSLSNMTVDTISALAKGTKLVNIETINRLKLLNSTPEDHSAAIQKYMTDELERLDKGGLISKAAVTRMQSQLDEVFKVMDSVADKFEQLIDRGYAPLMRFGNYAVEVRNKATGELDLFELYEGNDITGPLAQWKAIKDLEKKYNLDEYTISKGTLNPDAFKQFTDKGLNPETVQLFASELGLDSDGAIQAYLKVAISDRSALKRLIHRKKVPGYSEDMPRVVSAFVMSNARHSGRMLYNGEIENNIQKIKDGDLQGEAQNVFKNMEDPQEEYAGVRNTMFHWFMAFSPAFLLLNLTQPFTQTIPKLSAYSGAGRAHSDVAHALGIVGKYSGKATWNATKWVAGKDDPNWQGFEDHLPAWVKKEDYLRMSREGHLDPQNVWMIRGLERGKTGIASGAWGGFESLAGWPAEVSEGINRRSTMIAAFKTAKRIGPARLKQKGFDSDYEFAVSIIQQTQGIYNKGNRSGLARGTGKLGQFGPLVMVFKQFTINYVEQMIRHGRDKEFKSLALMMLWQFGIAGMFGLPFVDDLRDILEGMLYRVFGKSFNLADELENLMGETAAQNLMYGVPSNNNPIDFYGRSSMGNLLPLTDFARPNEGDWGELIGASSSFFENFYTASKYLAEGRYRDAVVVASPRYVKDAVNGYEIYTTGSYRNQKGDKVMDMSKSDGLIKGLGQFNPSSNAKPGRERSEGYHMKNMIKNNQDRYSLKLAEAIYEENDKLYDEIYEEMDAWNERNKEPYLIDIEKVEKSAENRVEKKDFGSAERSEKALPDQLEGYLEDKAGM